jgi:DNA-binding NtrC family response regulator
MGQGLEAEALDVKPIEINQDLSMKEYQYHILRNHLQKNNRNVRTTARNLGMSRATVYNYLKEMEATGIWH